MKKLLHLALTNYQIGNSASVGGPAPSWTSSVPNTRNADGSLSTHSLTKLLKLKEDEESSLLERERKRQKSQRIAKDKEIVKKNLKKYRERGKPGSKNSMTDAEALYLRREATTRSVSSLCRELKISRITADNCIKGITYKHLDWLCKPQF